MIVGDRGSVFTLLWWQKQHVGLFVALSGVVTVLHQTLGWTFLELPTVPLAVTGAALGIFVSFRTNSCYDRWWEGRKLWGRLINTSRHLALQALGYLSPEHPERDRIVRRHIAYVHTLRCLLRGDRPLDDDDVKKYLPDGEAELIDGHSNPTAALLERQMRDVVALQEREAIDPFRLQSFDESLRHLLDIQGGCERIKKTPLPKLYTFVSQRLIQWFSVLLPCGLVKELGWTTIPITLLVIIGFQLINEAGRVLEDPFNHFYNSLPLTNMSRTIEINLLELSGETDLPPPTKPNPAHVLM